MENNKLKSFFDCCNELIAGKFIMSDIKISKLLKTIATCEELYNLFAKCLLNFNYKQEFKNAIRNEIINGGMFVLPEENDKKMALVFCVLLDLDNQKFTLQNFINEYFYNREGYNISYKAFAYNILIPFKNAILNELNVNENGEQQDSSLLSEEKMENQNIIKNETPEITINDKHKILYANLVVAVNDLYEAVLRDTKVKADQKNEIFIITNAIKEALKLENIKIVNALIIPLEYVLGKNKKVKVQYDNVKMCLIKIYNLYA